MYSQTKSFVGIAIGLLAGEGKLSLDDPIVKFFPDRVEADHPAALDAQTVRQMRTRETCCRPPNWFRAGEPVTEAEAMEAELKDGLLVFRLQANGQWTEVACALHTAIP